MISDYQDDEGFAANDIIRNAPAYFDVDNVNDPMNLERFFKENKYSIVEKDKAFLEEVALQGMVKEHRRQYWLAITGAYG